MSDLPAVSWSPPAKPSPSDLREAIARGLMACISLQKGAPSEITPGLVALWCKVLGGLATAQRIDRAFLVWVRSERWFPTPADILEIATAKSPIPFVAKVDDAQPLPERCATDAQREAASLREGA